MTNRYQPIFPKQWRGSVNLPASKSISARALIMGALAGDCTLSNLSDCDDTCVLRRALDFRQPEIDIHAAGTAMRFSTAFFSTCEGETHILTGTSRMQQRPIRILVDALRQLGADIEYVGNEGFPPLRICGKKLDGGVVELPADVSSQYISALLMIGPTLSRGLELRLVGEVMSRPYIDMTVGLMKEFGAIVGWTSEQTLEVQSHPYKRGLHFQVEPDWSGASYWYEMIALTSDENAMIELPGLFENSWQGDSIVEQLFASLGVHTEFVHGSAILRKSARLLKQQTLHWDFSACPDLAQTMVVTCALLEQPFCFSGLQSLRIKETDRIAALQSELMKLGIRVESVIRQDGNKKVEILQMLEPQLICADRKIDISTYEDHRMAMAFAPAAMLFPGLSILNPEVVSKSYPSYWDDLNKLQEGC